MLILFLMDFNNVADSALLTALLFLFVIWSSIFARMDERAKIVSISPVDPVDLGRRKFLVFSAVAFAIIIAGTTLPFVDVQSENLLNNGDFTNGTSGWYLPPGGFKWRISPDLKYNNLPVLEVETENTYSYELFWSWVSSTLISVDYGSKYKIITHMRGENVLASSVVVQPYDENKKQLNYQLTQVPGGHNGNFPFSEYETTIIIPYGVHYIELYLNGGLALYAGNPGKTYFAELSVTKVSSLIR